MKTDGSDRNEKGNGATGAARPMSEEERARKTMQAQIMNMAKEFERALPGKIGVDRMMRIVMTAILKTPNACYVRSDLIHRGALTSSSTGA
jgi:hypothetical protein